MKNEKIEFSTKTIDDCKFDQPENFIGIITNLMPLFKTKGTDYLITIDIMDLNGKSLKVRIFSITKKYENFFERGDIIKFESIKLKTDNKNEIVGYLWDSGNVEMLKKLSERIENYAKYEREIIEKIENIYRSKFEIKNTKNKISRISEICEDSFFDFRGLCVSARNYDGSELNFSSAVFIDGTTNRSMGVEDFNEKFRNNEILNVIFWYKEVAPVRPNKAYFLRNLRIKKFGNNLNANYSEKNHFEIEELESTEFENLKNNAHKEIKESESHTVEVKEDGNEVKEDGNEVNRAIMLVDLKEGENIVSIICDQIIAPERYTLCTTCNIFKSSKCIIGRCNFLEIETVNVLIEDPSAQIFVMCTHKEIMDTLNYRINKNKIEHEVLIEKKVTPKGDIYEIKKIFEFIS